MKRHLFLAFFVATLGTVSTSISIGSAFSFPFFAFLVTLVASVASTALADLFVMLQRINMLAQK